jgi:transposase
MPSTNQQARIDELEAALAAVSKERDVLRASHERLRIELEMLKRRIYVAKAERVDTKQLELEFAQKLRALNELSGTPPPSEPAAPPSGERPRTQPKGRRDLSKVPLDEERIEVPDDLFEDLVAQGKAERIGFEESYRLAYKRGGMRKLVLARVKYRAMNERTGEQEIETAEMPNELIARSLSTPSLLAKVATDKHCDGLPLYRIEERAAREGFRLDRSTLCRWLEETGAWLGATIISAARKDAMQTAFCIATDATGIAVQPERSPDRARQACRRGHYFVLIADKDHIFFEYTPKETSEAVSLMFKDFTGYVQADAKSVYDVLFRKAKDMRPSDEPAPVRHEVGCWSHCRRKFWEAAVQKNVLGREGLVRIKRIFDVDASFAGKAADEIRPLRDAHLRPHMDAFFAWAEAEYDRVRDQRSTIRSALGYAVRQREALQRVLEDGRLLLDNNRSERELRRIAVNRKASLFVGSDDHGIFAGHIMSLIASARLHGLGPETYLRDILRVLPSWPPERYLELAPKYWAKTRARLDPAELAAEIGRLTAPDPPSTEEQSAAC